MAGDNVRSGIGIKRRQVTMKEDALIKKKIKLSSYIKKLRGIGCKVIYD